MAIRLPGSRAHILVGAATGYDAGRAVDELDRTCFHHSSGLPDESLLVPEHLHAEAPASAALLAGMRCYRRLSSQAAAGHSMLDRTMRARRL
jgi:hypothetical protein